MSTDETYNGWTNRETWAVALHINNDQGWQESVFEALREMILPPNDGDYSADEWDRLRASYAGEVIKLALTDIGSLWRVNWTELGASFLSDLAEQDAASW